MTEKRNNTLMLIFVTVLTGAALLYGFSTIPSPAKQRELKLDHKRVSDLGQIQYSVEAYYQNYNALPQTLDALEENSYSLSEVLDKEDPETKIPYSYRITSPTTYELCATFITDSSQEEQRYDDDHYQYNTYKSQFTHPKGNYCFNLNVKPDIYNPRQPLPLNNAEGATILPIPIGTAAAH